MLWEDRTKEYRMKRQLMHPSPKATLRRITRIMSKTFEELDTRYLTYAPLVVEVTGAYGADVGGALEEVFKSVCHLADAHATLQAKLKENAKDNERLPAEKALKRTEKRLIRAHKELVKIRTGHKR